MYAIGLGLLIIHILAFVAGGANSVIMPVIGPKLATATPEIRATLMGIVAAVAKVGEIRLRHVAGDRRADALAQVGLGRP